MRKQPKLIAVLVFVAGFALASAIEIGACVVRIGEGTLLSNAFLFFDAVTDERGWVLRWRTSQSPYQAPELSTWRSYLRADPEPGWVPRRSDLNPLGIRVYTWAGAGPGIP